MKRVGDKEGANAAKYLFHRNILGYPRNDIHIQTDRRGNQPDLSHSGHHDTEPYGVKVQGLDHRKENGGDQQHDRQRIHNTTKAYIDG